MNPQTTIMPVDTIKAAQDAYKKDGKEAIYLAYRDVISDLINNKYSLPIKNDSYIDALFLTESMFERTTNSISMLTGKGVGGFIDILQRSFEGALSRLAENNGYARIVILNCIEIPAYLVKLEEKFRGILNVKKATARNPIGHFIVCDDHMLRDEKIHGELNEGSPATDIKADVIFNNQARAKFAQDVFNQVWDKLSK